MTFSEFIVAALLIEIGDPLPLAIPALLVARNHTAGGEEAFRHGAAAFLGLAQRAPELIAEPRMLRPMMPAKWLIMRFGAIGDLIDQQLFGHYSLPTRAPDDTGAQESQRIFGQVT
jgi:hypothetical protein